MIGEQFAAQLSGLPRLPAQDDGCPICLGPRGHCTGPGVAHADQASTIREIVVARGQQQTRRAPGRPLDDPDKEAARQQAWLARQSEVAPDPAPEQVAVPEADPAAAAVPAAVPPVAAAVSTTSAPPAAPVPVDPSVQTLSPLPSPGRDIDPDAGSPRFVDAPTLVRTVDGAFRTQGVDARAGLAAIPEGDPTEVTDRYVVPAGVIDPVDDPHRPDPATSVLVSDPSQLIATGAWTSLPGGTAIVTTRRVLQVWYPMGTLSPSYSTVADRGAVLPRPVGAR